MNTKVCGRCGEAKPPSAFRRREANRDGLEGTCKACQTAKSRAWRRANPEKAREITRRSAAKHREARRAVTRRARIQREYGLTVEEYEQIVTRGCAVCGAPFTPGPGGTALDHDHVRGRVRDALCRRCNQAIGLFRDNPIWLRLAADYLETHERLAEGWDEPATETFAGRRAA